MPLPNLKVQLANGVDIIRVRLGHKFRQHKISFGGSFKITKPISCSLHDTYVNKGIHSVHDTHHIHMQSSLHRFLEKSRRDTVSKICVVLSSGSERVLSSWRTIDECIRKDTLPDLCVFCHALLASLKQIFEF